MAYAEANDVGTLLGRALTDEETALVDMRLEQVERRIKRRINVAARIAADPSYEHDVRDVEIEAVLRLVRNPEGYIQETDGNYTYMLSQEAASNRLTITDEEWDLLGYRATKVFTFTPFSVIP